MSQPSDARRDPNERVRFGAFELDVRSGELLKHGLRIRLQEQPLQILLLLLERPGEVVLRDQIRARLWPDGTVVEFDPGINAAVQRLRDALGDSAASPRFIETVARRGYRFVAELAEPLETTQTIADEPAPVLEPTPLVEVAAELPSKSRKIWWGLAALAACLGTALLWQHGRTASKLDSLAVLPFTNATDDPDLAYLADGITETLTDRIARIPRLKVMSRISAGHFKGADPKRAGTELGVSAVLLGEVRQRGDSLSVGAELVDTRDGHRIWGKRYERHPSEILAVEADLSGDVADQLTPRLSAEERRPVTALAANDVESYQLYLKGRYHAYQGSSTGFQSALGDFSSALARDPNYALAYAGMADMYWKAFDWQLSPDDAYPRGIAAARKAIELDPGLAAPHAAVAFFKTSFERDFAGAEQESRRGIDIDPRYAQGYEALSWNYLPARRFDEAREAILKARQLDPLDPEINTLVGLPDYFAGRNAQAVEAFQKVTQLEPGYWWAYVWVARAYQQAGQPKEALAAFEKAHLLDDNGESAAALALAYASAGQRQRAADLLATLRDKSAHQYISSYYRAAATDKLGDRAGALRLFEDAIRHHTYMTLFAEFDPMMDALRSDARFKDLTRHLGN